MGKLSKAWAGGIAGAVTAATGYVWSGGSVSEETAKFVGSVVTGFIAGFLVVYLAPRNKTV
jgi:fructose-specific phosphotransferase system IIC component